LTWNRVYAEEEEWFRSIFANSKKEDAIQNQYEFFVQRMGGPPLFSQRRGIVFLSRNLPFAADSNITSVIFVPAMLNYLLFS